MKKFMKVSIMAFVAMFAINTVVNAQEVKMASYGDESIALKYPADWESKDAYVDFRAEGKDGVCKLDVSIEYSAFDAAAIKNWANEMKEKVRLLQFKSGETVTKGNTTTIRSTGDKEVWNDAKGTYVKFKAIFIAYAVVSNGKTLTGEIWYQQKDDAKMKPVVENILASLKAQSE